MSLQIKTKLNTYRLPKNDHDKSALWICYMRALLYYRVDFREYIFSFERSTPELGEKHFK